MKISPKIKFTFIVIGLLFVASKQLFAQQTPTFSEYNYNPYLINPAYAGLTPNAEVTLNNSGVFNSFDGSPQSLALSFITSANEGKIGIGAGYIRDQIGVTTSTSTFATFSYKIFFDTRSNRPYWQNYTPNSLSFAVSGGLQQYQENLLDLGIMGDPNFAQNIDTNLPTVGVGILLNLSNIYVGFSSPNILGDRLARNRENINLEPVYYGYFGYRFYSNNFEELMIKPNILIKQEKGAPVQLDFNLSASFKNKFEIGTGYRTNSSINILAGIYLFNNLRLVYNYNTSFNDSPLGNTHGFVLSFQLGDGYSQ